MFNLCFLNFNLMKNLEDILKYHSLLSKIALFWNSNGLFQEVKEEEIFNKTNKIDILLVYETYFTTRNSTKNSEIHNIQHRSL